MVTIRGKDIHPSKVLSVLRNLQTLSNGLRPMRLDRCASPLEQGVVEMHAMRILTLLEEPAHSQAEG